MWADASLKSKNDMGVKYKFIKYWIVFAILTMVLVFAYGILVGNKMVEEPILLSLIVGLLVSLIKVIIGERINCNMKQGVKDLLMSLNKDEKIIVEGTAKHLINEASIEGKLVLTNDRLIFTSHFLMKQIDYTLAEIKGVYLNKAYGIFNKGFTIAIDGKEERFEVEYPADWKKIIKKQQEVNRDLNSAEL